MQHSEFVKVENTIKEFQEKIESDPYPKSAQEAWNQLTDGNLRFQRGDISNYVLHLTKEVTPTARSKLVSGQTPHATIVTCSDSRVPPELLFNKGLGNVFIIRLAGNVVDDFALGSIEYAVEHLHTPLIVVMGHQNCGAVKATDGSKGKIEGHGGIPALLKEIWPCCEKSTELKDPNLDLDAKIQRNVRQSKEKILKSKVIHHFLEEKKVGIVLAEYYFDTGKVNEISDHERDPTKICYGDVVNIKKPAKNFFLSSAKVENEKGHQIVFASTTEDESSHWIVRGPAKSNHYVEGNPVSESDVIRLQHKSTNKFLHLHKAQKVASAVDESSEGESTDWEVFVKSGGKIRDITLRVSSQFSLKDVASSNYLTTSNKLVKVNESTEHNQVDGGEQSFWVIERVKN